MKQKKWPQPICSDSQPPFESKWFKPYSPTDNCFIKFKDLFSRVGKIPNYRMVTHFHTPFKLVQAKGRRIPLHLLAGFNEELGRMETEGLIIKLEKCDVDCFISPIFITRKKDGSIKFALDSKLLTDQIFENKHQKPKFHELIDYVALQISEKPTEQDWFSNLDLKIHIANLNCAKQRVSNLTSVLWAVKQRKHIVF